MQRGECKTTEGGGSEDQRLIARLFVLPTVLNPRKTPDLGAPTEQDSAAHFPWTRLA